MVYHGGSWVGFKTYIYREIEDETCIIILTNDSNQYVETMVDDLKNILYRENSR